MSSRQPSKRMPLGTTPEQLLDDMKRVYLMQGELGIHVYRRHGKYSDATIMKKFGGWNRALELACLPVKYETKRPEELLGDELPPEKRTKYPCWRCDEPFLGLGKRKGEWFCDGCRITVQAMANSMGW